jgi:hypothetical protein
MIMAQKAQILLDEEIPQIEGDKVLGEELNETETTSTPETDEQNPLDATVRFINDKMRESSQLLDVTRLEIGEYVLDHIFEGDVAIASSRNPKKHNGYRSVCDNEALEVKPPELSQMLRVAAQERFLSQSNVDTTTLSYTHKTELIKLKNDTEKVTFVLGIVVDPPSTRELADRVKEMRSEGRTTQANLPQKRKLESLTRIMSRTEIVDILSSSAPSLLADESIRTAVSELKESAERILDLCETFITSGHRPLVA